MENAGEDHEEFSTSCACGEEEESEDRSKSLRNLIISAILFIAALIAEYEFPNIQVLSSYSQPSSGICGISVCKIIYWVLYLAAFFFCGFSVLKNAVREIFGGHLFDEQFLMTIASVGAIAIGEYPEAVAVMLFYGIGEYFQDYAVDRSRASISALMNLRPDRAFVIRNSETIRVSPSEVAVGEIIVVKPGERVPLDGIIESGSSYVDTSALTGESVPREVNIGAEIMSGFVNTHGVIHIKVTKPYGESAISRILELTEKAASSKSKSEKFITRFSKIYTPAVCLAAVLVAIVAPLFFAGQWSVWINRALIFLVVSCPCALVVSVPMSFFSGIGAASRKGILIKGSNSLETLSHIETAVFDKTGTLTKGVFKVTAVHPADVSKVSAEELVAVATHAELYSNHPISKSLKAYHHCSCCGNIHSENTKELAGQGLSVKLDGREVLAGNRYLMDKQEVSGFIKCPENDTGTIVHIAIDGVYAGHIVISDEEKDDAAEAISRLRSLGVKRIAMLTGDTAESADKTAKKLGVDTVFSQLLPEDKVNRVEDLLKITTEKLLFAGDGVNDAPVLARADIGVAMGALGSDAAIEAADAVIMDDKPSRIADGISIARRTMRVVRENIIFALSVKFLIMVLGTVGIASMWAAVFGDVGVTFIAVINALRLLKNKN